MSVESFLANPVVNFLKEQKISITTNYIPKDVGIHKAPLCSEIFKLFDWMNLDKATRIKIVQHYFLDYLLLLPNDKMVLFHRQSYGGAKSMILFSNEFYYARAGFGKTQMLHDGKSELVFYTPPTFREKDWTKGTVEVIFFVLRHSTSTYYSIAKIHVFCDDQKLSIGKGQAWNVRKWVPTFGEAPISPFQSLESVESNNDDFQFTESPKQELQKDTSGIDWNSSSFNVKNEVIDTTRTLSSIPTFYHKPKEVTTQRRLIVKYFEHDEKYAKVIPRSISWIVQHRAKRRPGEELEKEEIEGAFLVNLIRMDDPKLESLNPIASCLYFDEIVNNFVPAMDEIYRFSQQEETIIVLFVTRKHKYIQIDEYTKDFDDIKEAQEFASGLNQEDTLAIRYYDMHHRGFTLIDFEMDLPVHRTGTSIIKLLVQTHEHQIRSSVQIENVQQSLGVDCIVQEKKHKYIESHEVLQCKYLDPECKVFAQVKEVRDAIHNTFKKGTASYKNDFKKVFETYHDLSKVQMEQVVPTFYPEFGGTTSNSFLNQAGQDAVKRISCVIAVMNPQLEYCPYLAEVISMFLLFVSEEETYNYVSEMVKGYEHIRLTKLQHDITIKAFSSLFVTNFPHMNQFLKQVKYNIEQIFCEWMDSFFSTMFSLTTIVKIFENFVKYGMGELYRVCYCSLKTVESQILNAKTSFEIHRVFTSTQINPSALFIYKLSVKVKDVEERVKSSVTTDSPFAPYTRPKLQDRSTIFDSLSNPSQYYEFLWTFIPYRTRFKSLKMIFTSERDGYSILTLFNKMKDHQAIVFVLDVFTNTDLTHEEKDLIKDVKEPSKRAVIGCYLGDPIEPSYSYEGTTDSTVFSVYPELKSYKWSRKNDFFALGKKESISIGGGGRGPAINIDQEMGNGSSQTCLTFENTPLCSHFIDFGVTRFEAFTFE